MRELGRPKVTCLCATYKRPHLLPHAVESFLRQDYENRRLVILDDAGQYPDGLAGDRWRLVSTRTRFPSLGEKRNALADLADPDTAIFAVWDDDDIYLPWHLTASVAALADGDVAVPSRCWNLTADGLHWKETGGLFHASWSYRRPAFEEVGGYPAKNNGEDQEFAGRVRSSALRMVDPCRFGPPGFIHRWHVPTYHLSCLPHSGYKRLARETFVQVESITPHWDRDWSRETAGAYESMNTPTRLAARDVRQIPSGSPQDDRGRCIVSAAVVEPRYVRGIDRLAATLDALGDPTPRLLWRNAYPPDSPTQAEASHAFKPFCFLAAQAEGYQQILWLDSMVVPLQRLERAFDVIEERGWLLADNPPWTVGDHCTDEALAKMQLSREDALRIPSLSTATIGLDLTNPTAREFLRRWRLRALDGTFHGPRETHRYDQSAGSVIAHRLRMDRWIRLGDDWEYRRARTNDRMLFLLDRFS